MTRKQLIGAVALGALFFAPKVAAQYYYPMSVSGYTQDVIANGVGTATSSTTSDVDGVNFAFVSKDFQLTSSSPVSSFGLPVTGQFMTVTTSTPGLTYQFAPYSTSNSLKLIATNDTGTLTFTTPTAAFNLYFIATGGSGSAVANAVVNFTDGTSQPFTNLAVADWYTGTNIAIQGIGRVDLSNNNLEDGGGTNPRIYQIPLAISAANQSKLVQSVAFTKASGNGIINVFGISANKYTTCLAPTAVTTSNVTINDGTLNWTAPATVPASYDIYYTSSTFAPSTTTTPSSSGISGTTATMSGLAPQTRYHVWIRSNCTGNMGEWAYGTTFVTPCSTFTTPYSENFDSTATGSSTNTNAPNCWAYTETSGFAGSGYVTTSTPVSAPNLFLLTNSTATTGNQMLVSPQTIALSDGTKRVKFFSRGGAANYSLQVGTMTNPADASTFVSFNTTNLTTTNTQYTVNIPSGGGSYLAFRHNLGGTSRSIYLDNITVESIPTCPESVNLAITSVGTNSVSLSWSDLGTTPANNYDIYYTTTNTPPTATTVLNASNSTTSTTTTATVSGLSDLYMYYFWVRSRCSATDQSPWSNAVNTITKYCKPSSTNQNSWISAFSSTGATTNMNYSSTSAVAGTSGYQNLAATANTIVSDAGTTVPISVTVGGPTCGVAVWVDWDNDGTFSTTERVFATTGYITSTTGNIAIPAGTAYGNYRMRIVCDYNSTSPSSPCTGPTRGEYLDFTLQVASQLSTAETSLAKKDIKVSPNPFNDIINISEFKDIKSIKVSDVSGRTLKTIENPEAQINLGDLNAGLYILNLQFKDGSQKSVKVIKK